MYQQVQQVHKDYSDAIESARRYVSPFSRPVNDFFHVQRKANSIQVYQLGLGESKEY